MLEKIEEYLEGLCVKHKELRHNVTGKKAWFPFTNEETAPEKGTRVNKTYVEHIAFDGQTTKDKSHMQYTSVLHVLTNISTQGNIQANIAEGRKLCEKVTKSLLAKIIADNENGTLCSWVEDLKECAYQPIDFADQSGVGWQLIISWHSPMPEVDTNDWDG